MTCSRPRSGVRRRRPVLCGALALLAASCGGDATTPGAGVASVEVRPDVVLLVGVGDSASLGARVLDSVGNLVSGRPVTWTSSAPDVATVNPDGVVRAVALGTATVTAEVEGVRGEGRVEVWVPPEVTTWEPGTSYWGRREYVEYIPGTLPLVISAPHGGAMEPSEIPDRTYGTLVTDRNTVETLEAVRDAFVERTGAAPHVIISHLRRVKLDPNREIVEAAQGSPFAEQAWREFHDFIETAENEVEAAFGTGLYLDLHGHGHAIARVELGYLLSAADLERSDSELDAPTFAERSSIRALFLSTGTRFSQLLRGPSSLGGYLGQEGVPSVPSPLDPSPGGEPYFTGGYDTARHGSRDEGVGVSGIQVELYYPGLRDSEENRRAFARSFARAVESFMRTHYGFFTAGG